MILARIWNRYKVPFLSVFSAVILGHFLVFCYQLTAYAQDSDDSDSLIGGLISLVIQLVIYLVFGFFLQRILDKLGQPNSWLAYVPFVNLYKIIIAADKPGWWFLLFLIPLVNIVVFFILWVSIIQKLGKNPWLVILLILPLVNLVFIGYLALS